MARLAERLREEARGRVPQRRPGVHRPHDSIGASADVVEGRPDKTGRPKEEPGGEPVADDHWGGLLADLTNVAPAATERPARRRPPPVASPSARSRSAVCGGGCGETATWGRPTGRRARPDRPHTRPQRPQTPPLGVIAAASGVFAFVGVQRTTVSASQSAAIRTGKKNQHKRNFVFNRRGADWLIQQASSNTVREAGRVLPSDNPHLPFEATLGKARALRRMRTMARSLLQLYSERRSDHDPHATRDVC